MTWIEGCTLACALETTAARCTCDLERAAGVCPQCECLHQLADAVLDYLARCQRQENREARGAVD